MTTKFCFGLTLAGLLSLTLLGSSAEAQSATEAYQKMRQATLTSMEKGTTTTVQVKGPGAGIEKIGLVGQSAAPQGVIGVKIWGQLVDLQGNPGPFVNLTKYRWEPSQKFILWIESAVPVQMALFQNYPEGRPASRQVSPDIRFPASFTTILPGQPFRFPILLEVDNDLRDEQVSLIFVRADVPILPINGGPVVAQANAQAGVQSGAQANAQAGAQVGGGQAVAQASAQAIINTSTLPPNSTVQVSAVASGVSGIVAPQATGSGLLTFNPNAGTLKGGDRTFEDTQTSFEAFKLASETDEEMKSRLKIRFSDVPNGPQQSQNEGDVSMVAVGPGNIAQIELTLNK